MIPFASHETLHEKTNELGFLLKMYLKVNPKTILFYILANLFMYIREFGSGME